MGFACETLPRGEQRVSKRSEKSTAGAGAAEPRETVLFFTKCGEGGALSARGIEAVWPGPLAGLVHKSPVLMDAPWSPKNEIAIEQAKWYKK